MTTWVALYRGSSVPAAKVIAVSSDAALVRMVAERLINEEADQADPILAANQDGRRSALRLIARDCRSSETPDLNGSRRPGLAEVDVTKAIR